MAFAEINLRVINVLLQSDWLAQNLELEPVNPGSSALTNISFPIPANIRMRIHIREKIRLARETSVLRVCVCLRACLCMRPLLCACVRVFNNCMCDFVSMFVFLHECVFVGVYSCVNV